MSEQDSKDYYLRKSIEEIKELLRDNSIKLDSFRTDFTNHAQKEEHRFGIVESNIAVLKSDANQHKKNVKMIFTGLGSIVAAVVGAEFKRFINGR